MCRSYKGFGRFSLLAGILFVTLSFFYGFNLVRIAVAAFFLILGTLDLLFYTKYGER